MRIPDGPTGEMTVSPSQLRVYGAGGLRLDSQEDERGCPRLYKARYVDKIVLRDDDSYPLNYGTYFHRILELMDADGLDPDEAIRSAFEPSWPPEFITEARTDLDNYLARGAAPMDRYATIATEQELTALLYVDPDYGPVHVRGFIDWMGADLDAPGVVHFVDYKTNRTPPSDSAVAGDVQLKAYHYLIRENADRYGSPRRIVAHLDAIKWRDIDVAFSDADIDDWHDWCVAVVRRILRDEEAAPKINPGCRYCPIRRDCPAFLAIPDEAVAIIEGAEEAAAGIEGADPAALAETLAWRDRANSARLALENEVKALDAEFKRIAMTRGGLVVGDAEWAIDTAWKTDVDLRSIHGIVGDDLFFENASMTKSAAKAMARSLDPSSASQVEACFRSVPSGLKVTRKAITS